MNGVFRLGDWIVRPRRDSIERGDEAVHVKPKAMAVLRRLAADAGRVVTRDELFDSVWPGAEISDATLTQCVLELRKAFGDSARDPAVIETVPKVGFRLLLPVTPVSDDTALIMALPERTGRRKLARPGLIFALSAVALVSIIAWFVIQREEPPPLPREAGGKTIAVLPFVDLSDGQDQGWFANGLSEQLRTRLATLEGLLVIGRTFSGSGGRLGTDVRSIIDELGVSYLLEGTVRHQGDRLLVTAQLLDSGNGYQLWSERFERPAEELFDVELEITEAVAVALSITLEVGDLGTMPGGPGDAEAFAFANRAWFDTLNETTSKGVLEGIGLLRRAVTLDPNYATAWVRLAHYYKIAAMVVDPRLDEDWFRLAKEALDNAERLAPGLPLARTMRLQTLTHEARWFDAQRLIETDSRVLARDSEFLFSNGVFLVHVGRVREAIDRLELSRMLDPLGSHHELILAHAYLRADRLEDALAGFEATWARASGRLAAFGGLEAALVAGDEELLRRWFQRAERVGDRWERPLFAELSENMDDPEAVRAILRDAFEHLPPELADYPISLLAAYFGDPGLSLNAMSRTPNSWALWHPVLTELRGSPRFRSAVRSLGLPEYWRAHGWNDFCAPVGADDFRCG